MSGFEVEELTLDELAAIPDFIAELAVGCGYMFCGACGTDGLTP